MSNSLKRALAWRALGLAAAAPIGATAISSLAVEPAAQAHGQPGGTPAADLTSASGTLAATPSVAAQIRLAESRLGANLAAPHPGRPEALTHPDADHMSGRAPSADTGAAGPAGGMALAATVSAASVPAGAKGMDVSSFQGAVNWSAAAAGGATFAYMKSTEGTYYYDSAYFAQQYNGSYGAGLVRGAYHFAIPNNSTGAAQADYFVAHGGGWSGDGRTLPGTLDIEYNPYGAECYGLSAAQMVSWVQSFVGEYKRLTNRYPTIYTTTGWWSACTANSGSFRQEGLAIARYATTPGTLPASWSSYNIWQFADSGAFPGDQDVFNGTRQDLVNFAAGPLPAPVIASSVTLTCTAGDLRTTADATVQPGVVVAAGGTYRTETVSTASQPVAIRTSSPSVTTPLVAVWQNGTDCAGDALSRNAWAAGPTGKVYAEAAAAGPPAASYGDASNLRLVKPVVGMSPTSDGKGYWLVAKDGGVFSFGNAAFHGSTGGMRLNQPIVGMATSHDSRGYWLVASDGGIFSFGDARFYGSTGNLKLVRPIEAMVATSDGGGYWMVASDGGVFCFGDAGFHGSLGGRTLSAPISGMVRNGPGYTLIGADGRTYPFP